MLLSELCDGLCAVPELARTRQVTGLTADSRAVEPGFVFAAFRGSRTDGAIFIPDAVAAGAVAILSDAYPTFDPGADIACLIADDPRRTLALMAARFHIPQPETMVAVTGTAGKTSVAAFTRQIFEAAGHKAASLGTLGVTVGDATRYGNLTTPDPVKLQTILNELAADGITHVAMEASSHGLDQRRLDGVNLIAAGFTNLGRDHLDYHESMDDYLAAKMRLFDAVLPEGATAVVNADAPQTASVIAAASARQQSVMTVGWAGETLRVSGIERDGPRQIVSLAGGFGTRQITVPLAGEFQVANALIAAGLAIAAGVDADTVFEAIGNLEGAPGRLDHVLTTAGGADVYVDYAHKPEALETALAALRPFATGRLIVVIGAGGDRDPGKRPLMGAAAHQGADRVIVTDDNPRTEDPAAVRRAILDAAPGSTEIGDRRAAIEEAVRSAGAGDVVLIAGKGHETGQIVGDRTLPFSDHGAVRDICADMEDA